MVTSQKGINLIKKWEGCVLKVYLDVTGTKTIGFGHTGADVNALPVGARISQEQADMYLKMDLARFEKNVNRYDDVYHWTQNEFDALVCFAYNVGSIDQLVDNGNRDKNTIANKMLLYNKSKGIVLDGLTNRRKFERQLFLSDEIIEKSKYVISKTYVINTDLYVRDEPQGNKLKMDALTENAKAHAYFDSEGYAILKGKTKVTCLSIKELDNSTWMRIPSGWVCARNEEKIYIE
ncbi:MAG: lysozyme [Saccharofermentans sp.]|nr:lysozyme [Saccharofermentans sp.]